MVVIRDAMRKDWRSRGLEGSRLRKKTQICCISGLGCLFLGDWTLRLGSDWGCGWLDLKAADETAVERNWAEMEHARCGVESMLTSLGSSKSGLGFQ